KGDRNILKRLRPYERRIDVEERQCVDGAAIEAGVQQVLLRNDVLVLVIRAAGIKRRVPQLGRRVAATADGNRILVLGKADDGIGRAAWQIGQRRRALRSGL